MKSKKRTIIITLAIIIIAIVIVSIVKHENKNDITDVKVGQTYTPRKENIRTDEATGIKYINNEIMIMFNPVNKVSKERKQEIINNINGKIVGIIDEEWDCIQVEVSERSLNELEELIKQLEEKEEVFGAMTDTVVKLTNNSTNTNDPSDKKEWKKRKLKSSNWWLSAIQVNEAWDYNDRFNNIKIGIVDSGFDTGHEDLNINFATKTNEKVNNKNDHGTHVAGIIGATANNGKGIAGIVWNKELICYDRKPSWLQEKLGGWDTKQAILVGLILNVKSGAKVINFSCGNDTTILQNGNNFSQQQIDKSAYKASRTMAFLLMDGYDFVVVQASGNGDKNGFGVDANNAGIFAGITTENCYTNSEISAEDILNRIIVVGNAEQTDNGYQIHKTSNCGNTVDICAPGQNIYSTITGEFLNITQAKGSYGYLSGTSMAAPMVSSVASLVWSVNEKFTGAEVKEIVCNNYSEWVPCNPNSPYTKSNRLKTIDGKDVNGYPMVNAKLSVEEAIRRTDVLVVPLEEETNSTEIVDIEEIDNLEITLDNIDSLFTLSYENEFNNLFLACQYNKPSEIDLDTILYHGLGDSNNKFTSEECSLLNTYFDSDIVEHIGLTKIKESELNNYLKNKTGLKINEFNNNLNYIYIDKYKAYYRYSKTDTIAIIDFHFTNVEKSDDNIYTAIYIRDNVENTKYEVKFKVNNGVLQFISNKEMNEDENWKKEIESNESVQTTVNHTNDELKNNLTGYWCSKDGKNIIYFDACDPLFDAYYVDFRNDRYYLEVPYRVEELEYDKIALLPCDDGYDSYTFTLKNDQLISNDLVLNNVPCNYKTQFHGEWNNDKYKYDFKDTGKYYTSDEDNKWGHYYVINDSQIILFKEDKHFEIKKYIINENKLILDDDITLKKQGEYKNSLDKLNSLSNIICGTWIEKDTLMEEYRFYSNGLYERYSVVYNGEQLISSNCLESECYEIIDGNTVRIYTSDGLLSTDLKYDESTKILKIGSEYVKKE